MEEIWKDINGYEGLYQVSNLGRIRSLDRKANTKNNSTRKVNGRILKEVCRRKGYMGVNLSKQNRVHPKPVHRLVAETFIPNPNNYPCVNHKDEDPSNNHVDNLEWCTYEYNNNYGNRKTKSRMLRINGKTSKKVYQYDLDGNFINEFPSVAEVNRQLGYDNGKISGCCLGKRKTAYKYKWYYEKR